MVKGYAYFGNDPSVGIFPEYFAFEIPDFEEEYREQTRTDLLNLYTEMAGDFKCTRVVFEDETDL
jgi:hypothetical protein